MKDAAGSAPAIESGWLTWEVEGKPVSVRMSRDVASRLRMMVWEGFTSLRRRGLETGGLLFGTTREAGLQVVVEVDDFEPLEIEHASGPSYVLSEADLRKLQARIASYEDPDKPAIVGFYRSHTRGEFALTRQDAQLFSRYFPAASHVFLLIKSDDDGPLAAGFIIREGGKVLSESPYTQFPLPVTAITVPVRETPVRAIPLLPVPPRAAPVVAASEPRRSFRKATRPVWLATAAVIAVGAAVAVGIGMSNSGATPGKPGAALALNVTTAGNSLRLSWDRQFSHRTGSAVLWIKDGPEEQERFELDWKQLSEGSVLYWPRHGDVDFRLQVLSPGGSVTESVRAIGAPGKPPAGVAAPLVAAVPARPALQPEQPKRPTDTRATLLNATQLTARDAKPPQRNRTGTASRTRAFALPQSEPDSAAAAPTLLPDPPTVRPAVPLALEHNEEILNRIAPNGLGGSADPRVQVRAEPATGSVLEHLGKNYPLIGKRYRGADYIPPAPLHSPVFPGLPRRDLAKHVSIDVKVYVNPSGKVESAEVVSKVPQTERDLAAAAIVSAKQWEFVPARTKDNTAPGIVILHYRFGPAAPAKGSQAFVAR